MQKKITLALAAITLSATIIGSVVALTTYHAKSQVQYSITPDLTVALPSSLSIGTVAAGTSGTQTFSNGLTLIGTNSYTYTIQAQINGTFAGFSALQVQFKNSAGPACTMTLIAPTCSFAFNSPNSQQWDVVLTYAVAVVTTGISSTSAPISVVVSTNGP